MYVNTLITLQENLPTYAQPGQHIMGHVTLMSPGWIKCYVQNLKPATNESKYTFFIFSKAHQKGIRLGELSTQKETKWLVNEANIEESGLTLNDIDGVCIVDETETNGADTIAMGFMNGRYIIMPMIETILRKLYAKKEAKEQPEPAKQSEVAPAIKAVKQVAPVAKEKAPKEESNPQVSQEVPVKTEEQAQAKTEQKESVKAEEQEKDQKQAQSKNVADFIQTIVQKAVQKEDQVVEEALEEVAELEMIASTLSSGDDDLENDDLDNEEEKRVVDSTDAILSQIQDVETTQKTDASEDVGQTTTAKPKEQKKGMTPEDLLRVLTQVNNDQELKEKIAAFGKQLKVISQFATRNGKEATKEAEETIQNVAAPKSPSPIAQPLEAIEKLLGQEIEPKTPIKGTIDSADTSPRNALQFIKTYTQKKTKGHTFKKEKNKSTNYIDTIDKKIEDIQLRREQEMKDDLE